MTWICIISAKTSEQLGSLGSNDLISSSILFLYNSDYSNVVLQFITHWLHKEEKGLGFVLSLKKSYFSLLGLLKSFFPLE